MLFSAREDNPPWRLHSPAKINLNLHVLGKRRDGLHALSSIFAYCDWHDELFLTKLADKDKDKDKDKEDTNRIECTVIGPHAPSDLDQSNNLAVRAYHFALEHFGNLPAVHLELRKNIPAGAGLGGGSGNAAAMLRWALCVQQNPLAPDQLPSTTIDSMRTALGADTYPIFEGTARQWTGSGDIMGSKLVLEKKLWVLVVFPNAFVSTRTLFEQLNHYSLPLETQPLWQAAIEGPNDLQAVALSTEPAIGKLLESMHKACTNTGRREDDALKIQMSGSGSACFALFDSETRALEAAQHPDLVLLPQFVGPLKTKAFSGSSPSRLL